MVYTIYDKVNKGYVRQSTVGFWNLGPLEEAHFFQKAEYATKQAHVLLKRALNFSGVGKQRSYESWPKMKEPAYDIIPVSITGGDPLPFKETCLFCGRRMFTKKCAEPGCDGRSTEKEKEIAEKKRVLRKSW